MSKKSFVMAIAGLTLLSACSSHCGETSDDRANSNTSATDDPQPPPIPNSTRSRATQAPMPPMVRYGDLMKDK